MRRRITAAIVAVTAVVLIVLSIPLAVVVRRELVGSEVVELQAEAARALTEITMPLDPAELAAVAREPDAPPPFAVYSTGRALIHGAGPVRADAAVDRALAGETVSMTTADEIVVVTPITQPGSERVQGALRITEPLTEADRRVLIAVGSMVSIGAVAIAAAWLVARRLAVRLSSPVVDLARSAERMGRSEAPPPHEPVGIAEIDQLGEALVGSATRLQEALARERRFSSDVSHQLRTPLTALRLGLEGGVDDARSVAALEDLARVEATVDHLLSYARDTIPQPTVIPLDGIVHDAARRWEARAAEVERALVTDLPEPVSSRATPATIGQVLDILVDNALRHGRGRIRIATRRLPGGVALEVRDEGSSTTTVSDDTLFARRQGSDHGIGLSLARSLAESEGGRLLRTGADPTTFALVLLDPGDDSDAWPSPTGYGR